MKKNKVNPLKNWAAGILVFLYLFIVTSCVLISEFIARWICLTKFTRYCDFGGIDFPIIFLLLLVIIMIIIFLPMLFLLLAITPSIQPKEEKDER